MGRKSHKFIDRVQITVTAGNGGSGSASFRREKFVPRGGPDGGDGGRGGHIYLKADENTDSLVALYYKPIHKARCGDPGRGARCHGKNGQDIRLKVPLGTEIYDLESEEQLGEVMNHDEELMIARGGKGGLGNCHFKSSTHQTPREFTPGTEGQQQKYRLILKMISDVGLVGYPNAGKSTLISKISHAHPKVAPYPFTTLNPIIGTVTFDDYRSIRVADIPGLIDGAHNGVGLGHEFLRHIERTRLLLYVIDMAGSEGRHPADDYISLRNELQLYRGDLMGRPYIIIANKMDEPTAPELFLEFKERCGEEAIPISALMDEGVEQVKQQLYERFFPES